MKSYMKFFPVRAPSTPDPNGGYVSFTDVCIDTNPRFAHKMTSQEHVILQLDAERAELLDALKKAEIVLRYLNFDGQHNNDSFPVLETQNEIRALLERMTK